MKTRAVNLRREAYDVYIGRAGRGQDGYFGNPIRIGCSCPMCDEIHRDGGSTLPCYRQWFHLRLQEDAEFRQRVEALRGKTLGCFCSEQSKCHGGVIAEYVDSL